MKMHVPDLVQDVDVDIWASVLFYNLHNIYDMGKVNISDMPMGIIAINSKFLGALLNTLVWKHIMYYLNCIVMCVEWIHQHQWYSVIVFVVQRLQLTILLVRLINKRCHWESWNIAKWRFQSAFYDSFL